MGIKKDERPSYREFFYEKAGEAVYEWLREFCRSHPGFRLGTCDNGEYRVTGVEDDLPAAQGGRFCLFRMAADQEDSGSPKDILDVYGIDSAGLFMVSGTLHCFDLVFRNGNVYSFDDGAERGEPGPVRISCVNDRDLMMRIHEKRNDLWAFDFEKERIPLAFDHFLRLLKHRMIDLDEWLIPEVHVDGSIDLMFCTLYGRHPMYRISPRGQLSYVRWTGTEYKDDWQSAFDSVIELTDLPVYKKP